MGLSSKKKGNRKREEGKEEYSKLLTCLAMISRLGFVGTMAEASFKEIFEGGQM